MRGEEGRAEDNFQCTGVTQHYGQLCATHREPATSNTAGSPGWGHTHLNSVFRTIFNTVSSTGRYNFAGAQMSVPSRLNISEWRKRLVGYRDPKISDYLHYGWPINFNRFSLCSLPTTTIRRRTISGRTSSTTLRQNVAMGHC